MAEKELWKRVANDIGKELGKYFLLEIDHNKKIARLYNRRFDIGAPVTMIDGKWPNPGAEDILITGKDGKVVINKKGCMEAKLVSFRCTKK